MAAQKIRIPRTPEQFFSKEFRAELARIEKTLNALQNLKVQISSGGTSIDATGHIRFVGNEAIIVVQL